MTYVHFNAYSDCSVFPGSAKADVGWGGDLNGPSMASCVRNIRTENYYNLVILLQVTIDYVGDVFLTFLFISTYILLVLLFPGSAETDAVWGENVNVHLMFSYVWNIFTKKY